ncbi:OsmC family protein [Candidatus Bathyarchaeota archaeon]|nr:OsmC family protein [Candidatus Bathyarchaeota archaeon]
MSSEPESFTTILERSDGYRFKVRFDSPDLPEMMMDEPKPVGEGSGPNASRLLSAAIGHCLSASLLFCLAKARLNVGRMETTVETSFRRNERGRLRISSLMVHLNLSIREEDVERSKRCFELFEDFCVVTQSVRQGIPVSVDVTVEDKREP